MALEVRVSGAASLHRLAARMRAEGRKDLVREMGDALSKATDPLRAKIRESANETMPARGGYRGVFDKSLRFRQQRRGAAAEADVTLTTYADGKVERRDIRALNRGTLRHPVFGHRKAKWHTTKIRAGFWDRGVEGAAADAEKRMREVVDQYAKRLID